MYGAPPAARVRLLDRGAQRAAEPLVGADAVAGRRVGASPVLLTVNVVGAAHAPGASARDASRVMARLMSRIRTFSPP